LSERYHAETQTDQVEHVASHKGTSRPDQVGNERADQIANLTRIKSEKGPPEGYFTLSEEPFILKFKENLIQGDPRAYMKKWEKDKMVEIWREKAPKQALYIKKHLVQILRQAERVWKWAIDADDGKAWIYFIFAASMAPNK